MLPAAVRSLAKPQYGTRAALALRRITPVRALSTLGLSRVARFSPSVPSVGYVPSNRLLSLSYSRVNVSIGMRSFATQPEGDIIKVPSMGDSISEGTLLQWSKNVGEHVKQDEVVCNVETDKVTIDMIAPDNGVVTETFAEPGTTVKVGGNLYRLKKGAAPAASASAPTPAPAASKPAASAPEPAKAAPAKADKPAAAPAPTPAPQATPPKPQPSTPAPSSTPSGPSEPRERRVAMPRMRIRIAERLKDSQNTAAMLTTFNEVDMSALMAMRTQYKDEFEKKHGVKLGFMSAFVKASVAALIDQPAVNAVIDGKDIVYRDYYDISVAVASPRGLVVPVLRGCEKLTFAGVEKELAALGEKARADKIALEDMAGGTFTISNGGVFGSMFGTPIINPPQSAILGMHAVKDRPVVVNGQVVVRPIMYLALTYDHRLIDGREAVTFLKKIKECVEDPRKLLLDL